MRTNSCLAVHQVCSADSDATLDSGTQHSCIGLQQARAYCRAESLRFLLELSSRVFVFGDSVCRSLGLFRILLPTPLGIRPIDLDVVPPRVPALLGLDLMDVHGLQFLSVTNELECVTEKCRRYQ